jgi:predicted DCC family thiol-disulfide oxidoreductase YuxK
MEETRAIIFFDGSCGLCNRSVKFIMRKEKNDQLFFSPLQSDFAKGILEEYKVEADADSMMLLEKGKIYLRSSAALRSTKYLKGLWPLSQVFLIVPKFIRDAVYNFIARNRISWFGKADHCEMMTPELRRRFLE